MIDFLNYKNFPSTFHIRVARKAKSTQIKKNMDATGNILYKIYVTDTPEDGKANKAVIALIAKELGIAKSKITIKHGEHCRDKTIEIET